MTAFYLTLFLLFTTLPHLVLSIRCQCSTDTADTKCYRDWCEVRDYGGKKGACGFVQKGTRSVLACIRVDVDGPGHEDDCKAEVVNGVTQVKCWCRNEDYCNIDLSERIEKTTTPSTKSLIDGISAEEHPTERLPLDDFEDDFDIQPNQEVIRGDPRTSPNPTLPPWRRENPVPLPNYRRPSDDQIRSHLQVAPSPRQSSHQTPPTLPPPRDYYRDYYANHNINNNQHHHHRQQQQPARPPPTTSTTTTTTTSPPTTTTTRIPFRAPLPSLPRQWEDQHKPDQPIWLEPPGIVRYSTTRRTPTTTTTTTTRKPTTTTTTTRRPTTTSTTTTTTTTTEAPKPTVDPAKSYREWKKRFRPSSTTTTTTEEPSWEDEEEEEEEETTTTTTTPRPTTTTTTTSTTTTTKSARTEISEAKRNFYKEIAKSSTVVATYFLSIVVLLLLF